MRNAVVAAAVVAVLGLAASAQAGPVASVQDPQGFASSPAQSGYIGLYVSDNRGYTGVVACNGNPSTPGGSNAVGYIYLGNAGGSPPGGNEGGACPDAHPGTGVKPENIVVPSTPTVPPPPGVAAAFPGALVQSSGADGCVSNGGSGGACGNGRALDLAISVVSSPDSRHVYAVSNADNAVAAFARDTTNGELSQLSGTSGCVSETGSGGACADGAGLIGPATVAVSPDGKNVYVASNGGGSVAVFARNATSGKLTQLAGTDGCVSHDGSGGACATGSGLTGAVAVKVSGDGANVYVASLDDNAVAAFARDGSTGALTQLAGADACVSQDGSGGACAVDADLSLPRGLAVSPDGSNVYVASNGNGKVAVLDRTAGALRAAAGDGGGVSGARSVVVSGDGKSVYASSPGSNAVYAFARGGGGALSALAGSAKCIGGGSGCAAGRGLAGASGLAVSPDGGNVYVASSVSGGVAALMRNPADGSLQQSPSQGCINRLGNDNCSRGGGGLTGAFGVTVTPDGRSVYLASTQADALAVLSRLGG